MASKVTKSEKVLVTGGAGFIGSHVADELIEQGYTVVILDDLSGGFMSNVNDQAIFVKGSINNTKLIKTLFEKHQFSYIFHLAAYAAEGLSHFIRCFNYDNNLMGSINLVNAAIKYHVKCFVFTSSIAVYGQNQLPMREDMMPCPEDSYGISKLAVELDLEAARKMFGLNYIIFRPHNVYGERQNIGDPYRNVIGIFITKIMKGEALPIFGDGNQKRAFTHIDDVAPIISRSIEVKKAYNQIFNIGADKAYTVNKLARVVSKAMDVPCAVDFLPARNEVKYAYSDHNKVKKFLGYKDRVELKEGVQNMVDWAKRVGVRKSKVFKDIEITRNMPSSWMKLLGL